MEQIFRTVVNLSVTGSYVILAVLLARLLLRRAPKRWSYALWAVAGFRLVCPVSFSAGFSLFSLPLFDMSRAQAKSAAELTYVAENIGLQSQPQVTVGIPAMNALLSEALPAATPAASVNPMQVWLAVGTAVWCAGVAALLLYAVVSGVRLALQLRTAVRLEDNVWQSDRVRSPFLLGLFRPRIYVPFHLSAEQLRFVLAHERAHLCRGDHLVRLLGFLILTVHWMNPLCWLAFHLLCRDMEMSCDERVLAEESDPEQKQRYSLTLLSFAMNRRFPAPGPLAFGESGAKGRIRNALRWKKPALWVTVAAVAVCAVVVLACAANPRQLLRAEQIVYGMADGIPLAEEDTRALAERIQGSRGRAFSAGSDGHTAQDRYVTLYRKNGSAFQLHYWYWNNAQDDFCCVLTEYSPAGEALQAWKLDNAFDRVFIDWWMDAVTVGGVSAPFGRQYRAVEIAYNAPILSWLPTPEAMPRYALTEDGGLQVLEEQDGAAWQSAGQFAPTTLTKETFDQAFFPDDMGWQGTSAARLREENEAAWKLYQNGAENEGALCVLLLQEDGSVYLFRGHRGKDESDTLRDMLTVGARLETALWVPEQKGDHFVSEDEGFSIGIIGGADGPTQTFVTGS